MADTIVVTAITQQLVVEPVTQNVSIASPGPQGITGASGVVSVTDPIKNTGTSTSAIIGLDYSKLQVNGGTP
jgi:hypothetical protein